MMAHLPLGYATALIRWHSSLRQPQTSRMEVALNKKYKVGHIRPWTVVLLAVVTVLGGGPILHGCDSLNQDSRPAKERNDMELAKGYSSHDVAYPPLDLKVPPKTETATFALG
jgi:hypothetical protein